MSFAAPDANGVIKQSGRDYDLSDLANNTGVTTTIDNGITYYDFGTNRLHIQGTVWHDPDKEVMLLHHNSTSNTISDPVIRLDETSVSKSFKTISSWSVDSDGNYVIHHTGHSVEAGDAIRTRSVTSASSMTFTKARVLSVTADTFTLERGYYYAGIDSENGVTISAAGQYTRIPTYNYGKEYNNYGRIGYSDGTGIIISGSSTSAYDPDEYGFAFGGLSFFWSRGGTIVCNRPCVMLAMYDIKNTTFMCPRQNSSGKWEPVEMRDMGAGWWDGGKLININGVDQASAKQMDVVLENACVSEVLASWYEFSFRNFDASKNFGVCDFGHDGSYGVNGTLSEGVWSGTSVSHHHHDFEIVNSATGSNVVTMWRPVQRNSRAQRGNVVTKKEVSFNFLNASGNPIEGVELYLIDNPSDYAKNATFPPATSAGNYTTTPTLLNGVVNSNGSITYDYTTPLEYNATSDTNGHIAALKITTSTHIHEYNSNDPTAQNDYPNLYVRSNNTWGLSESDTRGPTFSDWDTDNFGGFYRVDRRSNDNTDADKFTFKFCSYKHTLDSSTQVLKGLGELEVSWVLFDDQSITQTNKTVVDGYTTIDNPSMFYDRAKSYLTDNFAGEEDAIVTRDGNTIDAGSYNVVLDNTVNDAFTFDGTTITINADVYTGNISSTGTITLNNDAQVVGTYGDISVLPYTLTNIEAGSTIQLYNMETARAGEIVNTTVGGTAGEKVTHTGTYANSSAEPGDEIRLRVTCQSGTAALLPYEVFGVTQSSGVSFKVNQQDDIVYNGNGIDGSDTSITSEFAADYTNLQIDSSETDGTVTVQEIYAFYAYSVTTADGIDNFFGAITPIDGMNYRINTNVVDLKIQNTTDVDTILKGGRLYRDDNTSVIDTDSATGAGTGSFIHDTGFLLQYIAPQVENAVAGAGLASDTDMNIVKSDVQSIKNNTSVIPGLL